MLDITHGTAPQGEAAALHLLNMPMDPGARHGVLLASGHMGPSATKKVMDRIEPARPSQTVDRATPNAERSGTERDSRRRRDRLQRPVIFQARLEQVESIKVALSGLSGARLLALF